MERKSRKTYHHGSLKEALVAAAEDIIATDGIEGFSLRRATRVAGVSPGAPTHHFGDTTGLLTAVSMRTYEALGRTLSAVPVTGNRAADLRALAAAYIAFATDHPGLFRLFGRQDLIAFDDPLLRQAVVGAMGSFVSAAAAYTGAPLPDVEKKQVDSRLVVAIATVHGLAHMAVEQRLMWMANKDQPASDFTNRLLPDILAAAWPDLPAGR